MVQRTLMVIQKHERKREQEEPRGLEQARVQR
jgi:hypothetical protein